MQVDLHYGHRTVAVVVVSPRSCQKFTQHQYCSNELKELVRSNA